MSDRNKQVDLDSECKDGQGSSSNDRFASLQKQIDELNKKVEQLTEDSTKKTNDIENLNTSVAKLTEDNTKKTNDIERMSLNIKLLKQQ